jgi:hypothetical protein
MRSLLITNPLDQHMLRLFQMLYVLVPFAHTHLISLSHVNLLVLVLHAHLPIVDLL